jgi:hypothetical protein
MAPCRGSHLGSVSRQGRECMPKRLLAGSSGIQQQLIKKICTRVFKPSNDFER